MTIDAKICPICNKINHCGNELGEPTCWCSKQFFPKEIFKLVSNEKLYKSCICKECLNKSIKH
ncbi:cysteine-rich CWC family protein [Paenisporosarcina sp. TG20]|uniref:cysteine-rich CWC family protein n=1 Tax=Paenisporosarcina sp. TG20 TaxID=1211706 RepID=UPI00037FAD4F|nr:cysteine-rich CWC family protein [Paenisporosarcina sp. TG20]